MFLDSEGSLPQILSKRSAADPIYQIILRVIVFAICLVRVQKLNSFSCFQWSLDCLDPLRSPFRWFERSCIVMRFMCDLTISKLHDAYGMDWTPPIIGDNQFSYPEISFSTNSQDFKNNFRGVMCP